MLRNTRTLQRIITTGIAAYSSGCLPPAHLADMQGPEITDVEVAYVSVDSLTGIVEEGGITFYATISDETGIGNASVNFPDLSLFSSHAYDTAASDSVWEEERQFISLEPESTDAPVKESRYFTSLTDAVAADFFSGLSSPISYFISATDILGSHTESKTGGFDYSLAAAGDTGR